MALSIILSRNMLAYRTTNNLSQEVCADACGISTRYWGKLERAEVNPSLKIIEKISKGTGLTPSQLLDKHLYQKHNA